MGTKVEKDALNWYHDIFRVRAATLNYLKYFALTREKHYCYFLTPNKGTVCQQGKRGWVWNHFN